MADSLNIEGRQVPEPKYDRDTDRLVREYKKAMLELKAYLQRQDVATLTKANARAIIKHISKRLNELDLFADEWIQEHIPKSVTDGVASTLFNLAVVDSIDEAKKIVQFNKLNQMLVEAAIADTQEDLLQVSTNVKKRIRNEIRRVAAEVTRANMARNVNGLKSMNREIVRKLRNSLGEAVETGIVDSARRRWKPEDYVETLTRTKMLENYRQAQTNEAIERKALYGIISSAGSKDACRYHEGRIIKLDPSAEGNYPTYEELKASNQIFHPRCVHHFTVMRDPKRLPSETLKAAEKQQKRGDVALASGKRNPKVD
jgi:Phage minor capsid protein 2